MKMIRRFICGLVAAIVSILGATLLVGGLIVSMWMGSSMESLLRNPYVPQQVNPQEAPTIEHQGNILELRGSLHSNDELQQPEYGIRLPATCLLTEAREVSTETHGNQTVLIPLSAEKQAQLACPNRQEWAKDIRCGQYLIAPDFIPTILSRGTRDGYVCMRSIRPLPVEYIHLPEPLQSMARVLPETKRLDKPDCTILRLAERYRNPEEPTGDAQPGDIELRFSYLPAEFPVSLRGKMGELYLTAYTSTSAFAADDIPLPPAYEEFTSFIGSCISCGMLLLLTCINFGVILSGLSILKFGVSVLCHRTFSFPLLYRLAITLALQTIAVVTGTAYM